jgi:serine/threonine-protein kinase RsbW
MESMEFIQKTDDAYYIKLSGEVDLYNVKNVESKLKEYVEQRDIIVDVSQLVFIDSIVLGVFLRIAACLEKNNNELILVNPQRQIQKLIVTANLSSRIKTIEETTRDTTSELLESIRGDSIRIAIPAKPMYIGVIRVFIAALASRYNFNLEAIEDIKVALTEVITNSIAHNDKEEDTILLVVRYDCDITAIIIEVSDNGPGFDKENLSKSEPEGSGGLGLFIVDSLMDEVVIKARRDNGTHIKMIKYGE